MKPFTLHLTRSRDSIVLLFSHFLPHFRVSHKYFHVTRFDFAARLLEQPFAVPFVLALTFYSVDRWIVWLIETSNITSWKVFPQSSSAQIIKLLTVVLDKEIKGRNLSTIFSGKAFCEIPKPVHCLINNYYNEMP